MSSSSSDNNDNTDNVDNLPKRSRGRPPKVDATDATAIISKIEEQVQRFSAKCADNLENLCNVIYAVAFDKKAPRKDRVGAAKYCIEKAEKFLKDGEKPKKQGEDDSGDNNSEEQETDNVISLKARN